MPMKRETKNKANSNNRDIEAAVKTQHKSSIIDKQQRQQLLQGIANNNNSNNNNNSSKVMLAQQEAGLSDNNIINNTGDNSKMQHKMSYCFKGRWILILSMIITLTIAAILVAMLTITLLDKDDQCFNQYQFQPPSYRLFSTKTTYSTAYDYLNSSFRSDHGRNGQELPSIFSTSYSLKTLNEQLLSRDFNCKVRQLHYFGRHASRYPKAKGIEQINKLISNIQARIDLSKFSFNNNNKQINASNATQDVCFNPLAQYKQWTTFMSPEQGNLIMDSGVEETSAIAQRLKSIFPEMFNAQSARIELGTTDELRTAQTALVFLRHFDNFTINFCKLEEFPTENLSDSARAAEITNSECYKMFIEKYQRDKLQFHKRCESYHAEEFSINLNLTLKEANRTNFITSSVSKKLKLSKDDQLSAEETRAIYNACKYESALSGSSIWCNLFSDNDLKFFEYMNDVDDFFNQAYGSEDQMKSACPVTTDLMKAFRVARELDLSVAQPKAYYYFTHSSVIQKILAASVDLKYDPEYSVKNIGAHFQAGTTPKSRKWRTSLFTPFSANLVFTLYECPRMAKSPENYLEFYVGESPLKVVASLNEFPIMLEGCSNFVCDLNELMTDSRINQEKRCKLEEICKKNSVFT